MNLSEITDRIHDLNIVDLISSYGVSLKKHGITFKACCPFPSHNEKTPSFTANPNKNIFKCFGCGKGGDAISFVMDHENLEFWDAVKDIAKRYNIELPEYKNKEDQDKAEKDFKHKQSLYLVNNAAVQVLETANRTKDANDYIKKRIPKDLSTKFQVGYAPDDWHHLQKSILQAGFTEEALLELGLISESKDKRFDFFRNRMMFPIHDHKGKIAGFSGRVIGEHKKESKSPKYLNSPESKVFKKSQLLFGLFQAKQAIQKQGFAWRVEGQTDVISMHQHKHENTIAPLGTALTEDHVKLLNRFTANVIILTDADDAGKKALIKDGLLFIDHGFNVSIVQLPDGEDPDSFLKENDLNEYTEENKQEYIVWRALEMFSKTQSIGQKADVLTDICKILISVDDPTKKELYIDAIIEANKQYGPRKKWNNKIKQLQQENNANNKKDDRESLPKTVSIDDFEKYGFYEDNNCYFFKTRFGTIQGSNFTLNPLFHLESWENTKRLFEITNEKGYSRPIEFLQKDLISISSFRHQVEKLGYFIFMASETELIKLKMYLYEKTETAKEITQMGWHKDGFWVWANGIYDGENFKEINKYGIVNHNEKNYYIAAFSDTFAGEEKLFNEERKYKFEVKQNPISLYTYTEQFVSVFGNNAMVGMCFIIAACFRDIIAQTLNFFPILNIFGLKNTGKTQMAVSMRRFFAKDKGGPNINNTTIAALAQYVSHLSNGVIHIDEYKENMNDIQKYEFLKGLWDGTGRSIMNMERDRKKETSAVDCGVILTGQEKPLIDPALFTRMVYITFSKTKHTQQEMQKYEQLKSAEEKGINHLINDILKHREHFKQHWHESYKKVSSAFADLFKEHEEHIQDRIFNNWIVLLSAYNVLEDKIKLPFSIDDVSRIAAEMIIVQNEETEKGDELGSFWDMVMAMVADGSIAQEVDFKIMSFANIELGKRKYNWEKPVTVLLLNHNRIFKLYRKMGRQGGEHVLPISSLEYYLKSHHAFLGKKESVSFRKIDSETGRMKESICEDGKTKHFRMVTTAYCFKYDSLGVNLMEIVEEEDVFKPVEDKKIKPLHLEPMHKTKEMFTN